MAPEDTTGDPSAEALPSRVPVLVVGAGPTGLSAANLLALAGIEVLVVERNPATADLPRAVALDDEAQRTMAAMGLADTIDSITFPSEGMRYYLDDGACFARVGPGPETFGFPKRVYFHQPDLERVLVEAADRHERVTVAFSTELAGFEATSTSVHCSLGLPGGETHRLEADYVLACDGGSSPVRTALGIAMQGETYRQDWIVLDLAEDADRSRFSRFFCDPTRPWVSIPADRGGRRYEFMLLDGEQPEEMLSIERLRRLLAPVRTLVPEHVIRKTIYTFHARIAEALRRGRILLLGDAAHMTPPFAGQGMNAGIRDVHNVAWKLALVLNGHAHETVLDSYEAERREPIWDMIQLAVAMGEVIMPVGRAGSTLRDALVEAIERFPQCRDYLFEMRFKPKPRYDGGLFVGLDDPDRLEGSLVGSMIAQPRVWLPTGETRPLDTVLGPGFALIAQDQPSERALGQLDPEAWPALAPTLVSFAAESSNPAPRVQRCLAVESDRFRPLRTHRDQLMLVRPDRYVAGVCAPEGVERLLADYTALLGQRPG